MSSSYHAASFIPHAVATELLSTLRAVDPHPESAPRTILELGARDAFCSQQLQVSYPGARIFAQDNSNTNILSSTTQLSKICSQLETLPLKSQSVDLVISNLALHWAQNLPEVLCEVKRVLKSREIEDEKAHKAAIFAFSLLGPYSFRRQYLYPKTQLMDFELLGSLLLHAGFVPIIEVEELAFEYETEAALEFDLEHTGLASLFNKADKFTGIYEAEVFYVIARC